VYIYRCACYIIKVRHGAFIMEKVKCLKQNAYLMPS